MIGIVDMWAPIVPSREVIEHLAANFPPEQLRYLEIFQRRRITAEEFAAYAPSLVRKAIDFLEMPQKVASRDV